MHYMKENNTAAKSGGHGGNEEMDFYLQIASGVLQIVVALISLVFTAVILPWVKNQGIPWLKEKRMYSLVSKFVMAAEKLGETGVIDKTDKKKYVIRLLKDKGVDISPEIEAFIESAVEELEEVWDINVDEIMDGFTVEEVEDEAGEDEELA